MTSPALTAPTARSVDLRVFDGPPACGPITARIHFPVAGDYDLVAYTDAEWLALTPEERARPAMRISSYWVVYRLSRACV